jgi:undecaprenyl-diphosphatase
MVERDVALCGALNRLSHPPKVKTFFVAVSQLGDGIAWYLQLIILPLLFGARGLTTCASMIEVGVVNYVLYKIIKSCSARQRPFDVNAAISLGTQPLDQYSFPSGHTMHAVAFSIVVMAHHPEMAVLLIPFSSLVALSRVVLGLHYPTDVIAGGVIGGYVASTFLAF